jgi:hypothetical protein
MCATPIGEWRTLSTINQNHSFIKFIKTQIDQSERQKHNLFLLQSDTKHDLFFIIQYWSVTGIKTQEKI